MEEVYARIKSKFYRIANIVSIAGFYIGGAMQLKGMNANDDKLIEAGIYATLLSGGFWLGRKLAEKQFKKTSDLENIVK